MLHKDTRAYQRSCDTTSLSIHETRRHYFVRDYVKQKIMATVRYSEICLLPSPCCVAAISVSTDMSRSIMTTSFDVSSAL